MERVRAQSLDRRHRAGADFRDWGSTGADGRAVYLNGARPTLTDAAPILRAGQADGVAHNPEQGRVRLHVDLVCATIHPKGIHGHGRLPREKACPTVSPVRVPFKSK